MSPMSTNSSGERSDDVIIGAWLDKKNPILQVAI